MTVSGQSVPPADSFLLAENSTSLLLMAAALFFAAMLGIPAVLQGKIRFLFGYWQSLPCLMFLLGALLMPTRAKLNEYRQKVKLAAFALLTLSPFPTWAARSAGNEYFELCSIACLASAFWLQLEVCQWLRSIANIDKNPILALSAKKTQFLLLCFSIIPLSAVYVSGLLGLYTGTSKSLQDVIDIWGYGRISMILRVFLYWSMLQFLTLCLYANFIAMRQIKKALAKENHEQN